MKTLKTILRIPLLLLIVWIGSVTAYEVMGAIRDSGLASLGWRSWAHACEGGLEVVVLVWIYRWLEQPAGAEASHDEATNT